jgi:ubiquinone/menaquinone biosynthesis C-methylase UbiE
MIKSPTQVREDFDRIALASVPADDVWHPYDRMLMSLIPPNCRRLLDLGCGTGRLTRAIAQRVGEVTAVDFSSEMLRVARERSAAYGNMVFVEADLLNLPVSLGQFDCVISVNLLHHLPVEQAAQAMKAVVAPGGLLIVHDLRRTAGTFDRALDGPRVAAKVVWRLGQVSRVRAFFQQRTAWAHHARGDVVSTAQEITDMRDGFFPGATLRQHFLWRYTLLWTNMSAA